MEEVPRDRVLPCRHEFAPVSREESEEAFFRVHALSENVCRGNGLWEPGEIRHTSRRVIGYLAAWQATRIPEFRERAKEGVEALLAEQKPAGNFVWYRNSRQGLDGVDHCLYDTGIAGRAFAMAGDLLGDMRSLSASRRAAEWAMGFPVSPNQNYNLFAVWHLSAQYRLTGEPDCLDSAVYKTREGGIPDQLPTGGWPGHNSWIWYHGIILRGMAELWRVLPPNHPFRPELRASLIAGINRLVVEQQPDGHIPPNPDSDRRTHHNAFILHALLVAESILPEVTPLLEGIQGYRFKALAGFPDPGPVEWPDTEIPEGQVVWQPAMAEDAEEEGWGLLPRDAFRCWLPGCESEPGEIVYQPAPVYSRTETDPADSTRTEAWEVRVLRGIGNAGFGFRVPEGTLTPGRWYRLRAWMRIHEPLRAQSVIGNLFLSAYGGDERGTWDPYTNCRYRVETPLLGRYRDIEVDFQAGECNLVFFLMQNQEVDDSRPVSLFVDDIELRELDGAPPEMPEKVPNLDCELMAFGAWLGYRYGRLT